MNIWLVFIWRPVRSESLVKLLRSSTEHYNTDQQFCQMASTNIQAFNKLFRNVYRPNTVQCSVLVFSL